MSWDRLAVGRALLLIHGTFSLARSAFAHVPQQTWDELGRMYGGRIFAFDHPTLHVSPLDNAQAFLDAVPDGLRLELDVLAHSRGGLVTRDLASQAAELRAGGRRVTVRKAVLVGVPNRGTQLTDGDHAIDLVDRYTNLLTALPDGAFTLTLEALLAVVKLAAYGAVTGLPGLRSMYPGGDYLRRVNAAPDGGTRYYAVAANFRPAAPGLLARFTRRVAESVIDNVFGEDNDGVVPTLGVYEGERGAASFPIPADRRLTFGEADGVHHCNYFGEPRVEQQLIRWLAESDH